MTLTDFRSSPLEREIVEREFDGLIAEVKACQRCPRMHSSARVLDRAAGPLNAPIMFIGEAPGRLGADASGIPFHGDKAGDNFERLISTAGLDRYKAFVTNAALCNPKDDAGNNSPPTTAEIANCSNFLKRQIDLVNPQLIVTLGVKALEALKFVSAHELTLGSAVRTRVNWYGRALVPLYHPGQRAMVHRSYAKQLADYYFVAEIVKRRSTRPQNSSATKADVQQIVRHIFQAKNTLSYFSLHKLFFLIEYHHSKAKGSRMSNAYMVRQKDGPYCVELHISKIMKAFPRLRAKTVKGALVLDASEIVQGDLLSPVREGNSPNLEMSETVAYVMKRYSHLTDSNLKSAVYLTSPMRKIIREELRNGRNMLNAPILFGEKSEQTTALE